MPDVSIVLPCSADHAGVLVECLKSLQTQHFSRPFEILVVNSHDSKSVEDTAKQFGACVVPGLGTNTAGSARNAGVAAARGEILAFIDADCQAESQWLSSLYESLSSGRIAVGGPVLNRFPFHPVATTDNLMQFVDQMPGRPEGPARELPGCNMAIQRHAFEAAGGFPEDIFPGEDTVFSQRLAHDWPDQVSFIPLMRLRHRGRTAIGEFMRHQKDFGFGRGRYALNISERQQMLGRSLIVAVLAGLRRAGYFIYRTAQWNILLLPRLVVFSPVLLAGLLSWAHGFSRGCNLAAAEQAESASSN